MVPGQSSSSCEVPDEKLPNSSIKPEGILWQDKKLPIIYKVPHRLRQVNEKAYEPSVISIGPYHHGKEHLKEMEDIKKNFFDTTAGERKDILRNTIRDGVDIIWKCYVKPKGTRKQFVEMVVLDGFFIVQLFRGFLPIDLLQRRYFLNEIEYDLLLLEYQLHFVVLEEMCKIMTKNEEEPKEFTDLALSFFENQIGETKSSECSIPKKNIKHLLALIHDTPRWRPSNRAGQEVEETKGQSKKAKCGWIFMPSGREQEETGKKAKCRWKFLPCGRKQEETSKGESATDLEYNNGNEDRRKKSKGRWKFLRCGGKQEETGKRAKRQNFIGSARDLENTGIGFERRDEEEEKCRALDIEFKGNWRKPKLRIPKLEVSDATKIVLRNLIAFEQFVSFREKKYVLDYVKFLDQLINSEQDVQLLCNSDIIENLLGDNKAVAKVFNRLRDNTYQSSFNFYYSDIFEQVNDHCNSSCNKHMANLHRTYFNSPWALLSFLAALFLLFLTFAQTTFTLLTDDCPSCVVLYIALGLLFVVIGLFVYMRFG